MCKQVGGAHFFAEEAGEQGEKAEGEVAADAPADAKRGTIECKVTYTVSANGELRMQWQVDASRALPAQLAPNLYKCVLSASAANDLRSRRAGHSQVGLSLTGLCAQLCSHVIPQSIGEVMMDATQEAEALLVSLRPSKAACLNQSNCTQTKRDPPC